MKTTAPRRKGRLRRLALAWLALLVASQCVAWWRRAEPAPAAGERALEVAEVVRESGALALGEQRVRIAFADSGERSDGAPAVLLLHGSPGRGGDLAALAGLLARDRRVITPSLPGFGGSSRDVDDYSAEANAQYARQLLDHLGIERAHVVGHSLGGAAALQLADHAPERVASLSLIASLGVVELELLGDQRLNHLVHGLQLAAIRLATLLVPHFGALERQPLDVPYARSFFDTDQRPLRGLLERQRAPLLLVHGERDFLVPPEAAREHHRIVPQSELVLLEGGHFTVFTEPERVAAPVRAFLGRVDGGAGRSRGAAEPARVAAAQAPFDPAGIPPVSGPALLFLAALLIAATLVSEDLTCIGAGLLVAQGRLALLPAIAACLFGIFLGDVLLFLVGRSVGRSALRFAPLAWLLPEARVARASVWFEEHGAKAIFLSRLMPGLRLPTYFAAGLARTSFVRFAGIFLLAGAIWTPILVGASAWTGGRVADVLGGSPRTSLLAFAALLALFYFAERLVLPLFTRRGRRLLVGAWRRRRKFEFWPAWVFHFPVALYVLVLALRHRSLALVTAVNPAIPSGGFLGESKAAILAGFGSYAPEVARFVLLSAADEPDERLRAARAFRERSGLALPLVLKPDVGQRGSGVRILADEAALERALAELRVDHLLQEHVSGREYGIFYARRPGESRGRILSITDKRLPELEGDGRRTLEELILADERAVCLAETYFGINAERLRDVPAPGERVRIARIGTHCRGAIFLDGAELLTPALEQAVDALSQRFRGFWFGRYDVRVPSEEHLRRGEGLRVLELNGLSSEPTHVYDPRHTLGEAYRCLLAQWRLAFEIAAENRARGARPARVRDVLRELWRYRRLQRAHA